MCVIWLDNKYALIKSKAGANIALKIKVHYDTDTHLQIVMQIYILVASLYFLFFFQCCDTALVVSARPLSTQLQPDTGSELRLTQITGAQTCLVSGCTPGND